MTEPNPETPPKVAINPLPWILGPDRFDLSTATITEAVRGVANAGFTAVHADVPSEMTVADYRLLLLDHGLQPAPGYFAGNFDEPAILSEIIEQARRHASIQLELGLTEVFMACHLAPQRIERPAAGADFRDDRLEQVIEAVAATATAVTAEGLRPCFHPHVGTWIETECEVRALLDAVDPKILAFGPDTGHLFWAGMNPSEIIAAYAGRVGAVHLKDVHLDAAKAARDTDEDYWSATYESHVWSEPGSGDIDFEGVLNALPERFDGWFVVEVDVPDRMTKEESTAASARWAGSVLSHSHPDR